MTTTIWIIQIWALVVGSMIFPSIIIVVILRNVEGKVFRFSQWAYILRAIDSALVAGMILTLPFEGTIKLVTSSRVALFPLVFCAFIWAASRIVNAVITWLLMLHLTRALNGNHKVKTQL